MRRKPIGRVWRVGEKVHARIQVDGSRFERVFTTDAAAWAWLKGMRERATGAPAAPATLLTVGKSWLDDREKAGRVRHVRQERSVWRAHVETWHDAHRPLRSLTRRHVHDFVSRLGAEKGVSRQTVKHVLRLVRQVVAHAHDTGVIGADPIATLRVPREAHVSAEDAWTWLRPDEIARVLATCSGPEQRALVATAIYTGLRKGELWQLRWSAVHLDADVPDLEVRGKLKSAHAERRVPLLPPVVEALRAWHAVSQPKSKRVVRLDALVWPSASGGERRSDDDMGWASKRWRAPRASGEPGPMRVTLGVVDRAELGRRVRFHDLRHTCASHLVQGTWGRALSLEEVRQWLGHSSIGVTQRYAHMSPKGLRAAALQMSEHLRAKGGDDA